MKSGAKKNAETVEYGKRAALKTFISTLLILAAVFFCSLSVSVYLFPAARVYDESMMPTLGKDTIVLINKAAHIGRGDVAAFYADNKLLIKRCVAVCGDTVDIDADGNVYLNGVLSEEKYAMNKQCGTVGVELPYTVPKGSIFVLADNREDYSDSRNNTLGTICEDEILGKVIFKLLPFKETGIVK